MMRTRFLIAAVLALAGWLGWMAARPTPPPSASLPAPSYAPAKQPPAKALVTGWKPPEGNPVQRYHEGKTAKERYDMISNFMALGHDQNALMLIEALKDEDKSIRVFAVESAASLEPTVSAQVLKEAILNDNTDTREMAWSLLAPHPIENKVPAFMAAIERGSDVVLEESFKEMGRTPEMPLFETMLTSATRIQAPRQTRVFNELKAWLEPGGGELPTFRGVDDMVAWWSANKQRYDQFMLRVDQ